MESSRRHPEEQNKQSPSNSSNSAVSASTHKREEMHTSLCSRRTQAEQPRIPTAPHGIFISFFDNRPGTRPHTTRRDTHGVLSRKRAAATTYYSGRSSSSSSLDPLARSSKQGFGTSPREGARDVWCHRGRTPSRRTAKAKVFRVDPSTVERIAPAETAAATTSREGSTA